MRQWVRFFLGTPQRFLATLAGIGLIVVIFNPLLLAVAVNSLLEAINPLLGPVLAILIVLAGIRIILGSFGGGGRGRRR